MRIIGLDMIPAAECNYLLNASTGAAAIIECISKKFRIEETAIIDGEETLYDTFDWRLYRQQTIFSVSKNTLMLKGFDGRVLHRAIGRKKKTTILVGP